MLNFMPKYQTNINKKMTDEIMNKKNTIDEQIDLNPLSLSDKNLQIDNWINSANNNTVCSDLEEDISNIKTSIKDLESQYGISEEIIKKNISILQNRIAKQEDLQTHNNLKLNHENRILIKRLTHTYKHNILIKNKQIKRLKLRNRRLINYNKRICENKNKVLKKKNSILKVVAAVGTFSFYYLGYKYFINALPNSLYNLASYTKEQYAHLFI